MKKIAFIHPDLGIGGAEQLVVNLCLAVKAKGYEPHIFTPRHHQSFPQTHDGTIIVHEHGSFFGLVPQTIFGKFKGILAYIRSILCVLWLLTHGITNYQLVVADQVSVVLPLLKLFRVKSIFYCHYPDKLLSGRRNLLKKIYRFFLDLLQQISLLCADKIYVNSSYTQEIFNQYFSILKKRGIKTQILYPSIDLSKFDEQLKPDDQTKKIEKQLKDVKYFFSLNRYQRKKNIGLAIQAYATLLKQHSQLVNKNKVQLVIAGGYDLNVIQNIQYKQELIQLAKTNGIEGKVHFYTAISNQSRKYLLRNALAVLYTPQNQHFGIVPVQAMFLNVPVIADNSGGPRQSVGKGCGYLCKQKQQWTSGMLKIIQGEKLKQGRKQVLNKFSFTKFTDNFHNGIQDVLQNKKQK